MSDFTATRGQGELAPVSITGLDSLARFPDARVLVVDCVADYETATKHFPSNPVILFGEDITADGLRPIDASILRGRKVIVWPADNEGPTRAKIILDAVLCVAAEVKVVSPGHTLSVHSRDAALSVLRDPAATVVCTAPPKPPVEAPVRSKPVLGVVEPSGAVRKPDIKPEKLPEGFSQDALGALWTVRHADWRYVAEWGRWFRWDGQRWAHDNVQQALDLARIICREQAAVAKTYNASAGALRTLQSAANHAGVVKVSSTSPVHARTAQVWDADPWVLNTPDGILDLRTGRISPADPAAHCTKMTRVSPAETAPMRWLSFLADATNKDIELMSFLRRVAGYAMTGVIREHALFFCYGTGGNGKGTFLNTLNWILGDYAKTASMETFTESKSDRHPTEIAGLMGARLVSAQETEEGRRWAESRIKSLTGGDPITARFMRCDDFTFAPQFKLVIVGNHKPGLRNVDDAIRRRLHLIPFTHKIPDSAIDTQLSEKLREEGPGILQWMLQGCLEWQRVGLAPPASVRNATDEYLTNQDAVQTWIDECCQRGNSAYAPLGKLFNSYRAFAEGGSEFVMGRRRFSEALESRGYPTARSGGLYQTKGLELKDSAEPGYQDRLDD